MDVRPIRTLPTNYTSEEKLQIAETLSALNIRIETLMNEKANLPKRIAALQAEAAEVAKEFKSGKANKQIDCYWKFDTPSPGKKTLCRADTDEELNEVLNMTLYDIEEAETVFNILGNNFQLGDAGSKYIEFTDDEGLAVLKTILSELQANIIINHLSEFRFKKNGNIIIEQVDFTKARNKIKNALQSFTDQIEKDSAPIEETSETEPGEQQEDPEIENQEEEEFQEEED